MPFHILHVSIISILANHLCNTKNKTSDRINDEAHPVEDVTAYDVDIICKFESLINILWSFGDLRIYYI